MTTKQPETAQQLRQRAEEQVRVHDSAVPAIPTPEETQILIHELRVHQIELEMQNEALRRSQHDLEVARARYFELYDLAPVGYLTFNKNGLIQEANLAAASMLGVVRSALLQDLMSRFILPEDEGLYYQHRKQTMETGEKQAWEMRLLRADGTTFWAHLQITPAQNGEYWITLHDISERKQAEEERLLLEQQFQQTQKLESLGVLAGGIAHDFNNILTIIICNCSLAMKRPHMTAELIPEIEKAAERAADLCRQMLAYAGKSMLTMKQVKMTALVGDMLRMLKATISQNVTITADLSEDISFIRGDASQLRQIVMNLIVNAAEAIGGAQGEIWVSLKKVLISAEESDRDHLGRTIPAGPYVCLEVTDNGCGMDDETRQRIFEPFYTTKFAGRGLGMSATLGIIMSHKGALQLSSQPGQGASFRIYLPVAGSEPAGDALLPYVSLAPWQGNGTVLLVEDEVQLLVVAKALLEALGFTVIEAANGLEALELYRNNAAAITLVLTDIGMPVMDGYVLIRELNKMNPKLPIIISSGFGDANITSQIAREDIAGLVSKPYSFAQLQEVLKKVLGGVAATA